jgi:hypothetical protein
MVPQLRILDATRSPLLTIGALAARVRHFCVPPGDPIETGRRADGLPAWVPVGALSQGTRDASGLTIVHPSSFELVDRIHTEHGGRRALANCAEVAVAVFRPYHGQGDQFLRL